MRPWFPLAALIVLAGCATPLAQPGIAAHVGSLLPADAILIGEQHDAAEHQQIQRQAIALLAARRVLAGVVVEMAEQGRSTEGLPRDASEDNVREALAWNDKAWPWAAYGPAVMAAVRAGAPVHGGNLPRERMRAAMADVSLDVQLPAPAFKAQQQAIRVGHCNALPESQILPMTRVQLGRDQAMARTLQQQAVRGKTLVLLAGGGHVDAALGVPQHLPSDFRAAAWVLPRVETGKDYCAEFRKR